jgi:capsid assembly protease
VVDSTAASGGIALGVAPTAIYAIPSARVGSIGVYRMHVSYEGALKEAGIKVTFAAAGEHKVDGNPYQDLPDAVLNEWREQAGKTWDDFIALVAEARGLSEDDVRATQARIYRADEALAKGLIDAVKTQTEAVSAFLAELADADPLEMEDEEQTMAEPSSKGKVAEATSGLTESDLTKIASMVSSMVATSVSTAIAAQDRKQSITAYAASKGVAELGAKLAANAAITEEEAIAMIDAAAPKGKGNAKVKAPKANNRVEDEDGDEGEGDDEEGDEGEGDEGEGDEDGDDEEVSTPRQPKSGKGKAKSGGKRDRVNHFEQAMRSQRSGSAGAANSREGGGGRANPLLSAHHMATGANWSAGRK